MILQHVEPDLFVQVPDYHPAYGLPNITRAKVLCLIIIDGLPVKEAARRHNLSQSTVYKWLASIHKEL